MNGTTTQERGIDSKPTARVNTSPDGDVLGACLFLGKEDLEALGVDDADSIQYTVENGTVKLEAEAE